MVNTLVTFCRGASLTALGSVLLLNACSDSNDAVASVTPTDPSPSHPQVVLRDVNGDPLPATSTAPYSPRATCGRCHDIDEIARGYHFEQGRVDALGRIEVPLQQAWRSDVAVLSPGMFGKW